MVKKIDHQRPSDVRSAGIHFTVAEQKHAAKLYESLPRPKRPPVKR